MRIPVDYYERKYMNMIEKIGAFLDELNGSKVWEYLKSIIAKISKLLGYYEEEEAQKIIDLIPQA